MILSKSLPRQDVRLIEVDFGGFPSLRRGITVALFQGSGKNEFRKITLKR
jgi:hypothetical protein